MGRKLVRDGFFFSESHFEDEPLKVEALEGLTRKCQTCGQTISTVGTRTEEKTVANASSIPDALILEDSEHRVLGDSAPSVGSTDPLAAHTDPALIDSAVPVDRLIQNAPQVGKRRSWRVLRSIVSGVMKGWMLLSLFRRFLPL